MNTIYIMGEPHTNTIPNLTILEDALDAQGWAWDDATGWWPNQIGKV